MTVLLTTLGVAALLFVAIASAITLSLARRMRFVAPQTTELQPQHLPEDVRKLLAPGLAELDALGFAHPVALRMTALCVAGQPLPQHGLVLLHKAVPAAAYVVQLSTPDRGRAWSLFFVSRVKSGHTLMTRNRASVAGPLPLPDVTTQDCWARDWPTVWRAHRRRMRQQEADPAQWRWMSPTAWVESGGEHEARAFQVRVQRGDLVEAEGGVWRFGLRAALQILLRAWRTSFVSSRAMMGDAPVGTTTTTATSATEGVAHLVETFEQDAAARQAGRWSNGAKWLLFFVTAAAAAASFGLSMDLGTVPALVAVLLFHELGHFAAMRGAGYRDLKVFFLPFLGAAASGRHDHPSAAQELAVLFAGPVPGLVLGLAALWWLPADAPLADWWRGCAALAVTINAFNLLPIHPLDGGKIFEILFLGRWPWLAFGARALGVVALAGLAMTMDSIIGRGVLWGVALLMLLGLGHQRQEARLAAALRAEGLVGGLSRTDALHALFAAMLRLGQGARDWATQRALAEALLPAMTRPRLSRLARGGGLVVYAFFLLLPLLALLGSVWFASPDSGARAAPVEAAASDSAVQSQAADTERAARQLDAMFASLRARVDAQADPAQRWALLVEEFDDQAESIASMGPGRLPAAEALLHLAEALAAQQADARSAQALLALWQTRATADAQQRQQRLLALMARYDDAASAPPDAAPLARASLDWLHEATDTDPPQRAQVIERALSRSGPPLVQHLRQALREFKVEELLAQGDGDGARRLAQTWFDAALAESDSDAAEGAAHLRVDLVLAQQGAAPALAELDAVLAALAALPPDRRREPTALRRLGMQLAEVAGRRDWQRAQVAHLQAPPQASDVLPWWGRALVWWSQRGATLPPSWLELEYRHWQGDEAGAAGLAAALKKHRLGGFVLRDAQTDGLGSLSSARARLHADARRALLQHYGITVPAAPAKPVVP